MFAFPLRGILLRSAVGMIYSGHYPLGEYTITNALKRKFSHLVGRSYQEFQGIVRQAFAITATEGGQVGTEAEITAPRRPPVDPSIDEGGARYRYRVLIEMRAEDGTSEFSWSADLDTEGLLTAGEARERALEMIQGRLPRRSYRQAINALGDDPSVTVTILSLGRRA
jgi:hypothetical protein